MLVLTVRLVKTGLFIGKNDELARVIEEVEGFDQVVIADLDFKSSQRIISAFTWENDCVRL